MSDRLESAEYKELSRLIHIVDKLRHPVEGCPWDLAQTHQSLIKYLVEESYEFIHAVDLDDKKEMEEEIGDVLLQVLLHARIASEKNHFNIESVAKTLADKLIHRHPHVFKKEEGNIPKNVDEVLQNWNELKKQEGKVATHFYSIKDTFVPSLTSSYNIGKKSKKINFDWDDAKQVLYKVEEEWQELKDEVNSQSVQKDRIEEEMGDLLFSMAQLARHLDLDPEVALKKANQKFIKRFSCVEDLMRADKIDPLTSTQTILDTYWNQAKKQLKDN